MYQEMGELVRGLAQRTIPIKGKKDGLIALCLQHKQNARELRYFLINYNLHTLTRFHL